jgi:Arc/MetJ-type ribon-helix-helix transcriptional regulator
MVTTRYGYHRNYRLPTELVAKIRELASGNGLSESEAIRRLLYRMIQQMSEQRSWLL